MLPAMTDPRPETRAASALADLDAGRSFEAHEAFEALWRDPGCPASERALWKGLAQLAAGWVHLGRENLVGAEHLFARAARTLSVSAAPIAGIDAPALAREAAALADEVARGETPAGPVTRGRTSAPGR